MAIHSWLNGQIDYRISKDDRALHFGDGLFETFYITSQGIRLFDLHLYRLKNSLARLKLSIDMSVIQKDIQLALDEVAASNKPHNWRLKYVISRGQSQSAYAYNDKITVNRLMILQTFERDVERLQTLGVNVRLCQWRLSQQPALAGIKHLNRLDQVMGRNEWQDEAVFEGLMADQQGRLIEGTMSNLFAVDSTGQLITPPLQHCGVAGVMRSAILNKFCVTANIACQEAYLPELASLSELFISNALIGIVPIVQCEQYRFDIGPVTQQLQNQLHNLK
ncbi:MAG: aminodeoxychorismate lyase [Pseudomonadales bacterium]|nr:aminodeoxychorismate lyase [Pseudomonadales bacterium]